jgi:hypothetical protein
MGHPIHKHMGGMKSAERYDAKEAYNKDLSSKARMHYLENDIADKKGVSRYSDEEGMSRKASPLNGFNNYTSDTHKHPHAEGTSRKASPANNINYGTGYIGDKSKISYNENHVPQREMAAGKKSPNSRKKDY